MINNYKNAISQLKIPLDNKNIEHKLKINKLFLVKKK